jgi:hypothetical protein
MIKSKTPEVGMGLVKVFERNNRRSLENPFYSSGWVCIKYKEIEHEDYYDKTQMSRTFVFFI